jgi:hypothetical protein
MRNRFTWSEWSGAVGDLGTTLPIAFALVEASGFAPTRLFFLWGLVYVATGAFYRIPMSVQPLKAMAVIAITSGVGASLLSTTAVFYGVLLLVLVATGLIQTIDDWFSAGLVRGVQFGIGLLLAEKALGLVVDHSVYLGQSFGSTTSVVIGTALVIVVVGIGVRRRLPVALLCAMGGVLAAVVLGVEPGVATEAPLVDLALPDWTQFGTALTMLMIPQLPLTLGNAVYAASDACRRFWPERADRATAPWLATSIGGSNVLIGLLGGFPICHGAGGIAAHERLGGRTGGTTMILGAAFVALALIPGGGQLLFLIPVPILGALLLWDSWAMVEVLGSCDDLPQGLVATTVGLLGWTTHHLTIAVAVGAVAEWLLARPPVRYRLLQLQRRAARRLPV